MKKSIWIITLLILGCACLLFGCDKGQLEAPQDLRVEGGMLIWSPVKNADLYAVYIDNDCFETESCLLDLGGLEEGDYRIEVIALDTSGDRHQSASSSISHTVELSEDPFEEGSIIYENQATKNLKYTLLEDKSGYEVSMGNANLLGNVIIPDYYKSLPVKRVADYAFAEYKLHQAFPDPSTGYGCNTWTTGIRLPGTITEIGREAFGYCIVLEKINLPKGLKLIGESAFTWDLRLPEISIPDGVKRIEEGLFTGCQSLAKIKFPTDIEYFASADVVRDTAWLSSQPKGLVILNDKIVVAYKDTESNVVDGLPDGVEEIVPRAFFATGIKAFSMDKWIKVGDNAFSSCKYLTSVTLPDDCTEIPTAMFSNCIRLNEIAIPSGVKEIGARAFSGTGLTGVEIPFGCEVIGGGAFLSCESLARVVIPSTVTKIGGFAFSNTAIGGDLVLEQSIDFGEGVFKNCVNINTVKINCETVPQELFFGCTSIKSVTVEGCTSVGTFAFAGLEMVERISLPDGVTSIGNRAFQVCTVLKEFNVPSKLKTIDDYAFSLCPGIESFPLPAGILSIGEGAFQESGLKSVTIPDGVTIGKNAFKDCVQLTTANIGAVTVVTGFAGCENLKSVTLAEGVREIDFSAFTNCTSLEKINLPSTLKSVKGFSKCSALTEIIIPDGVESVSISSFSLCGGIKVLVLPVHLASKVDIITKGMAKDLTIFYKGTPNDWKAAIPDGYVLPDGFSLCFYLEAATNYPADGNTYWRFVDGSPEKWVF